MGEFSSAPANPQNGYWYRNTTDKKCYVYQDGAWYVMTEDGKNGLDGEGSISADLDDEMQSVACSLDGTVVFGLPITTTFSMFYGTTELPLDSLSVGSITGVTATADRSTGIVKVTAITAAVADVIRIPITGRVTYKGSQYERTLHLSINKVKPGENGENGTDGTNGQNAVIYSLQPSTNIIKRDADGNSDVSNISCRVMKTDGTSTVVSSLPVGYSMDYIIDSGNATSYTPDKQISVSGITEKIQFRLYNETSGVVLIDRETIAVVSDGKKGLDGINGEDGKDGLSITWKGDLSSAPANPQKNWAYRNTSNGIVYIYNGTAWELMVADGQDGTDGTDGTDGLSVFITYHDSEDEPSRPTGSGTSGGWHTNATKDVVWISQKVASSASSGTWGDPIRFKGLPGKYTELRYKYAFGKPATPTGTNPAGWSLSPDREDITFSYSGNFTKDGDYYVSPSPTSHSSTYKQRVSFTTRRANQMIHIEIDVSSEQNYDKGIVEALDTSYSSSNEHAWEGSGVTNAVVDIAVPTAGSHFVEIVYTKDGSTSSNEDRVKFRMLDPTTCWYSTAVIDGKTTPSWSEPVIFPTDSKTEEQVYLLAKSKRNVIDLPTSNEYVNEYIGDAPEYSSSKFYSAGNIVKYNNVYKVAIQAHSGIAPTNEAYWEDVLWWVDNPRGASETYPYEYTCERTLQDGKWGEYKNYRLFGHYGKDGEPGEDANLLPWVERWDNNKTLIDGEYVVSPKMFSGTKDSGGKLTGIALGRDCITVDGEKRTGIFALVGGNIVFKLDPISEEYEFQGSVVADSITMKDFAHLSQAIFKGDFMFSQQGIDADGNPTSNYQEFNQENPQGGNFKPNLAFNLKTGDQYSNGGHVYGFATNTPIQANGTSVDPDKVAYSKVNILFSGTSSLRLPNDKKFDGVEFTIVSTASRSFDGSANIYREGGGDTNYSATGIHYKGVEIRTCYMRSEGSFIRLIAHWNGSKLKYYVVGHSDNFAMIEPILNTQGTSATLGIWFVDRVYTSSTSMRVYYNDINLFLFMLNVYSGKDAPNTGGLNFTSPSS